jgi:hypothetical protein
MIDEPVPTMPEMVPATSPTARMKAKLNIPCLPGNADLVMTRFALRRERPDIDGRTARS